MNRENIVIHLVADGDSQSVLLEKFLLGYDETAESNITKLNDTIFCLIDYRPKDKNEVVGIFSRFASGKISLQAYKLLHWCEKYQEINGVRHHFDDKEKLMTILNP